MIDVKSMDSSFSNIDTSICTLSNDSPIKFKLNIPTESFGVFYCYIQATSNDKSNSKTATYEFIICGGQTYSLSDSGNLKWFFYSLDAARETTILFDDLKLWFIEDFSFSHSTCVIESFELYEDYLFMTPFTDINVQIL